MFIFWYLLWFLVGTAEDQKGPTKIVLVYNNDNLLLSTDVVLVLSLSYFSSSDSKRLQCGSHFVWYM